MRIAEKCMVMGVVGALIFASGCSSNGTTAGAGNKTLVVATAFTFQGPADPAVCQGNTCDLLFTEIYQTLLQVDVQDSTKIDPLLAQSYVISPDAKSVTFTLRQDVRFSDGSGMTADDVAFSLMRIRNLKNSAASYMEGLTATASDKYTVVVSSATPNLSIPSLMALPANAILNSKVVKANGGSAADNADKVDTAQQFLGQHSQGSAPYILDTIDPQAQIVLKANPNYWGAKPAYSKVVMQNELADTQILDVQKGSNTIAMDLSGHQASALDTSKVTVVSVPSIETFFLELNVDPSVSQATASSDFRQAIRYGIDYKALLNVAGSGTVQAPGLLAKGMPGALPSDNFITRDVAKAKTYLTKSGVKNPMIEMDYESDSSPSGVNYANVAQAIQANLKDVGINVVLHPLLSVTFVTKWKAAKIPTFVRAGLGSSFDPGEALFFTPSGLVGNWAGWKTGAEPTIEALASQAASATTTAQRNDAFVKEQARCNEDAVFIPLFNAARVLVASKSVGGLNFNALSLPRFWLMT